MGEAVTTAEDRVRWHDEGWCLLRGVFADDEVVEAVAAASDLFPAPEMARAGTEASDGSGDDHQPRFPFESPALNRLVVHHRLVEVARELLGVDDVRLYQGLASAKYSSGAGDEQLLHVDYGNHTLVVPRGDPGFQHLELFVYLSDVGEDAAPTRMVSRRLTAAVPVERTYLSVDEYADLYRAEVPAVGPAGSVLAYRPDTYHRGTALLRPGGLRILLHAAYKPLGTDWLGFQSWPYEAERMAWHRFVAGADLEQLVVVGFPEPGHPYWTPETLRGVEARYPTLDLDPWCRAMAAADGRGLTG